MVADLMPFAGRSLQDLRILFHAFAKDKKSGLDMARSQQVEKLGSQSRVRTVIKSESHVRLVNVDIGVDEASLRRSRRLRPFRCGF